MKQKRWLCIIVVLCLTAVFVLPASGQETGNDLEPVTGAAFAALAREAFPGGTWKTLNEDETILTWERALAALCGAIGAGGTEAENLAFAIENDLISGAVYQSGGPVTVGEARALAAAFAAYQAAEETESRMAMMMSTMPASNLAKTAGAVPMAESTAYVGGFDYNGMNDESYASVGKNRFQNPLDSPFSTFALDVDTASYANIRRILLGGLYPDKGAVRIEEMLNYFDYDLPKASAEEPVAVTTELNVCPWNEDHLLAMVALSSYEPDRDTLPGSNLVFLVDVSGSMEQSNRLPLARQALKLLLSRLTERDTVAIVTYAGTVGTLLEPTKASEKETIEEAIDGMRAGGSTNGAGGIEAAYQKAREAFIKGGNNRVILMTDGDFNVGVQSASGLEALIESERDGGIYLSVLGFGMGNLKDYEMETLADHSNGNYAYIDTLKEAKKVLVDEMTATIFTVANDVKLQVEFNPATVSGYRLLGYENRALKTEDFTDDSVDAGEMGAGSQMIALYEIIPATDETKTVSTTTSRYQDTALKGSDELLYVSVRYQLPKTGEIIQTGSAAIARTAFGEMSENLAFASAVAEFGLLLLDSQYKGDANLDSLLNRAAANRGEDAFGYRAEFAQIVALAKLLKEPWCSNKASYRPINRPITSLIYLTASGFYKTEHCTNCSGL